MVNSGFAQIATKQEPEAIFDSGQDDLVAIGRPFLASPDLTERWRIDALLNEPDQTTFHGGGAKDNAIRSGQLARMRLEPAHRQGAQPTE